ncbi:hypothetical protein JH67_02975 [Listeria monocytogenes]|nr:hypothetical protein [Listeria monocytogenes]
MKPLINKTEYVLVQRELAIRKARRNFYAFCRLLHPDFYKPDRVYLKDMCDTLQDFYEDKIKKKILIINLPPRFGKTFTARLFILWAFGQDKNLKVMTASYNQMLSVLFAQQTRDGIMYEDESLKQEYFTNIFPSTKIKQGDAAKGFWSLDGSPQKNYLATSPGGTSTGIGARYLLVDDIIKSAQEAYNERTLESIWEWYNSTLVQRMERPRKQILIMTRWSTGDLAGRMIAARGDDVHVLSYRAQQEDGTMLCDDIMTAEEFEQVTQDMNEDIKEANYNQVAIDIKGRLYTAFKTYTDIPRDEKGNPLFTKIWAYTDTADTGEDYFCMFVFGEYNKEAYVLDVVYTQEPVEASEGMAAKKLFENRVNHARFERNNGGRMIERNVRNKLQNQYNSNYTKVDGFYQSKNKVARILSSAGWVMEHIYFPVNWTDKWPELHKALFKYQRAGKNAHDDAPDALTGICETLTTKKAMVKTFDF